MNTNKFIKFFTLVVLFICKEILNELITCYIYIKHITECVQKIYYNRSEILIFNYKKLFLKIVIEIKNHVEKNLKTIYKLGEYLVYKYILNYSFYKMFFNYLNNSDYKNLILHVCDKLDIFMICKNKIKIISTLIYLLILYIYEKSKKNFDEFEFFLNNIEKIENSDFYTVLDKILKSFDIKIIKLQPLKDELEFFKNIFHTNSIKYILLNGIN